MFKTFLNVFKVPELRNKVLFTLFMLLIYRIGYHVTIPGADQAAFAEMAERQQSDTSAAGRLASYVSLFSGGNLNQSTIFGLGVMPYISASIIMQLLTTVVPTLEKLKKEGQSGQRKIQEWTRFLMIPLCLTQAIMWLSYMEAQKLVAPGLAGTTAFWVVGTLALTAGSVFLMWVGEQIDEYGLGNGISLIILAGIVSRMPSAVIELFSLTSFTAGGSGGEKPLGVGHVIALICAFLIVVAGSIWVTQAQRRIPIQQAKHTRGRKVYGGQKQYLPLRVNHGGVMPIIFAQSLMLFPGMVLGALASSFAASAAQAGSGGSGWFANTIFFLNNQFGFGQFLYFLTELCMIYFFAYFWTTVQFQPKEMANQLRDYGSFVPGLRPGKRTADYLEKVMMHITYVGAGFLCVIAVVPIFVTTLIGIPYHISAFIGGTGLLIVVSVALDVVQRIEANLLMRNYSGFLSEGGNKGKRIKGRQY